MQKSILLYGIILTLSLQTFTFAQGGVMQIANPSEEAKANALKNPFGLVYLASCSFFGNLLPHSLRHP